MIGAVLWAASFPAQARSQCGDYAEVTGNLWQKYQEVPVMRGLTVTGWMFEVLQSPEGKTWTVLVTNPGGVSCLVSAGENMEFVPRIEPDRPDT